MYVLVLNAASSPQDACEDTTAYISCGDSKVIDVTSALYGREGGREDDVCGLGVFTKCGDADQTLMEVKGLCQHKHRCEIDITTDLTDPNCGSQYLHVEHTCLERSKFRILKREMYTGCFVSLH